MLIFIASIPISRYGTTSDSHCLAWEAVEGPETLRVQLAPGLAETSSTPSCLTALPHCPASNPCLPRCLTAWPQPENKKQKQAAQSTNASTECVTYTSLYTHSNIKTQQSHTPNNSFGTLMSKLNYGSDDYSTGHSKQARGVCPSGTAAPQLAAQHARGTGGTRALPEGD